MSECVDLEKCGLCKNKFSSEQRRIYTCYRCTQLMCDKCECRIIGSTYTSDGDKFDRDEYICNMCLPKYVVVEPTRDKITRFELFQTIEHEPDSVVIAEGCIFKSGKVCVNWLGETQSIVIWNNISDMRKINCPDKSTRFIKYLD